MSETAKRPIKVLFPEVKIQQRIQEIAHRINQDYRGKELTAICTLKGSFIFFSDLIRHIDVPMTCEFMGLSSYGSAQVTSGEVKITLDITEPLEGKHVLIVEDIVDTGLTLDYMLRMLQARKPASIKVCSFLVKPKRIIKDVPVDYVGFQVGDEFVVGYGLDDGELHRGLPYIGYFENEH